MSRILFISPPLLKGSGGEVIRKRNLDFLSSYAGKDNVLHFVMNYYALYPFDAEMLGKENYLNKQREDLLILKNLNKVLDEYKPDLIHIDNSLIALPDFVFNYKTEVFFHNIEINYVKQDKRASLLLKDMIYNNEKYLVEKASKCICINTRDSNELYSIYKRKADYILPISFKDTAILDNNSNHKGDYLLFVGSDFYGNTDGLFWFIENCLDDIKQKLIVVGKGMEKYNNKYTDKKVNFLGFVNDLSILYNNASCVVLPIISGSGMKTKTCEAMMYGKKCFGTKEAFEGYKNINEANVSICDDKNDFINNINTYLDNDNRTYLESSRTYFLKYYEEEIVKNKFEQFLKDEVNI